MILLMHILCNINKFTFAIFSVNCKMIWICLIHTHMISQEKDCSPIFKNKIQILIWYVLMSVLKVHLCFLDESIIGSAWCDSRECDSMSPGAACW